MKQSSGYVFENKGKWIARVTFTDSKGKRRNIKRVAPSKVAANKLLKEIVAQLENEGEKSVDFQKLTFNDLADFYETHYAKPAKFIGERKIEGLRDLKHVKAFLVIYRNYFGRTKLREITYSNLLNFKLERLQTPTQRNGNRSITTVNRELTYLRRIFNIALQEGWILKNPFNCGKPLIQTSAERKRERILTFEEEARLLASCEVPKRKHLKSLLIALLDTGARKGEMLKLKWSDINFSSRLITIQALNSKTLKRRQLAMTQRLYNELFALWEVSNKNFDSLVFGISDNVRKSFSSACKDSGIKEGGIDGLTLHCLRHTAATRLVKGQLPIQMVGRILGHSQPQTTYRYISANEETLHQAASILDSVQLVALEQNRNQQISELIN